MGRGERTKVRVEETGGTEKRGTEVGGTEVGGNSTNKPTDNKSRSNRQNRRQATSENKSINKASEVNLVNAPIPVTLESEGEDISEVKIKPKRKSRTTKKDSGVNAHDLSMLISGTFGLISMKAGQHWQVSEDEANSIAKPLENILRKMDLLEKVSNVSDGAMLLFAVSTVTIPRVLISQQIYKQNKKVGVKNGQPTGSDSKPKEDQQRNNSQNSNNNINRIETSEPLSSKLTNPLYQPIVE